MSGYITFAMAGRNLAAPLEQVREIVRAAGVEALPGSRAPVSGLLELRGEPLPIVDLRTGADGVIGDIVVLNPGTDGWLGLAVDRVDAVVGGDAFTTSDTPHPLGLPDYVTEVLQTADEQAVAVFAVDLWELAGIADQLTAR